MPDTDYQAKRAWFLARLSDARRLRREAAAALGIPSDQMAVVVRLAAAVDIVAMEDRDDAPGTQELEFHRLLRLLREIHSRPDPAEADAPA